MKKIKVLHLASFEGNVGDNANHKGFRKYLRENTDFEMEFSNLEIREFYWKQRFFDPDFVALVNQHDLLIIGGGNYFELWVEHSATGTSIDIEPELFKQIQVPVFFNALGVDSGQGVPEASLQKFKNFLDVLLGSEQYLVSVRNDGAMATLQEYLPSSYSSSIHGIPDGGFFTSVADKKYYEIPEGSKTIAINVAGDMLETRFADQHDGVDGYESYLKEFAAMINTIIANNDSVHIVFVPHIFRDVQAIADVLQHIDDAYRRRRVRVAPCLIGDEGQDYIFGLYSQCELVLGTRFHTNVCSIGLGVPTVGLVNYRQIEMLYKELGLEDRMVKVNKKGFSQSLQELIEASLESQTLRDRYAEVQQRLAEQLSGFHKNIVNPWLKKNIS